MNQNAYLKILHEHLLLIMDEIDRVCVKNGIKYFLGCGTLIGAIRHQGFIPWDDDMDILMPYQDFEKFIEVAPKELSESLYLRWITTEKNYVQDFAKVAMKGTLFQEYYTTEMDRSGIFVDIFPIYPSSGYKKAFEIKKRLTKFLHGCMFEKGLSNSFKSIRDLPRLIVAHLFSSKTIYRIMLLVINPKKEQKATHYACYIYVYPIKRQVCPKDWYGDGVLLPFEDRMYKCPNESLKKLQLEYGDNVMQLPPIEKRKVHYPKSVVFRDGQKIEFPECQSEVSYDDIIE